MMLLLRSLLPLVFILSTGSAYLLSTFWPERRTYSKKIQSTNTDGNIVIYNTLNRRKEAFEPLTPGKVSFYSCGPTVYDYAHVGNFRAFLMYDTIKRWLQYCGYNVDHVCNLTDVDDKIIIKMLQENKSLREITEFYTNAFFADLDVLNIVKARVYPKATEHISDIEDMVKKLIDKGYAYKENGSVYFRVSAFPEYGKLAGLKAFDEIQDGAGGFGPNERRGNSEKESSRDFALWKAFTEQDGEVVWNTKQLGPGRPGWHIECSAMCYKLLGPSIDIHAGGVDLVFPHHTNEVAQTEAFTGQQFSKYWMHNGFVNINNEKMSKSLKNFKTLKDIVTTPFDARAFRYMVVTSQYRSPLNFNEQTLKAASSSLKRIDKMVMKLKELASSSRAEAAESDRKEATINFDSLLSTGSCIDNTQGTVLINKQTADLYEKTLLQCFENVIEPQGTESKVFMEEIQKSRINFETAMSDDLNAPRAVAALFKIVSMTEKGFKKAATASTDGDRDEMKAIEDQQYKADYALTDPNVAIFLLSVLGRINAVLGIVYEPSLQYFESSIGTNNDSGNLIGTEKRLRKLMKETNEDGSCKNCSCGGKEQVRGDGEDQASPDDDNVSIDKVKELAERRMQLKLAKQYQEADELRDEIAALGYGIKDRKGGFDLFEL